MINLELTNDQFNTIMLALKSELNQHMRSGNMPKSEQVVVDVIDTIEQQVKAQVEAAAA